MWIQNGSPAASAGGWRSTFPLPRDRAAAYLDELETTARIARPLSHRRRGRRCAGRDRILSNDRVPGPGVLRFPRRDRIREDAGAIVVSEPDTPATPASLSPKLLTADLGPISPDRRPSFFYALCLPETNPSKPQVGSEVGKAQDGWALRRSLACGSGPAVPLPSRSLPEIRKPGGCTLVFDPLPSDRVPAGRCRFEVCLEIPGDPPETRTREFEIVSSSVPPGH